MKVWNTAAGEFFFSEKCHVEIQPQGRVTDNETTLLNADCVDMV